MGARNERNRMIEDLLRMQQPDMPPYSQQLPEPLARKELPRYSYRGAANLNSVNIFGLASKSESLYPEAFKPVDTKFWEKMSAEEALRIEELQASAAKRVTYEDEAILKESTTAADEGYALAQGRRNQVMRRHKKPRSYEEKRKLEQLKKELPLERRFMPQQEQIGPMSQIASSGPLDTPVLLSVKPRDERREMQAAPKKLRGGKRVKDPPNVMTPPSPEPDLPSFDTSKTPKAKVSGFKNQFGLSSRSELLYPEAYRAVSKVFWMGLTREERQQVTLMQARAMEKAGYERGAHPMFIEDPFAHETEYTKPNRRARTDDVRDRKVTGSFESVLLVVLSLILAGALGWLAWQFSISPPKAVLEMRDRLAGGE